MTEAMKKLPEDADEMPQFADEKVMKDCDNFVKAAEQYKKQEESAGRILTCPADRAAGIAQTLRTLCFYRSC